MGRYEFQEDKKRVAAFDGEKEIGEVTFSGSDSTWIIDHTYVDEEYRGKNVARKLVDTVAGEAKKQGKKVMATCPYALKVFKENEEYTDVFGG